MGTTTPPATPGNGLGHILKKIFFYRISFLAIQIEIFDGIQHTTVFIILETIPPKKKEKSKTCNCGCVCVCALFLLFFATMFWVNAAWNFPFFFFFGCDIYITFGARSTVQSSLVSMGCVCARPIFLRRLFIPGNVIICAGVRCVFLM